MPETNLSFAKIVATPTDVSWAQAYNAGSLFVVLSLSQKEKQEDTVLNAVGKDIFNNLEAEFFTLEEKDLASIENAIKQAVEPVPASISLSFCIAFVKDHILYVYCQGGATALLKRGEKVGAIATSTDGGEITAASGFLHDSDTVILETQAFSRIYEAPEINPLIEGLPNEIAEALSPKVHNTEEGGASAIILSFRGNSKEQKEVIQEKHDTPPLIQHHTEKAHEKEDEPYIPTNMHMATEKETAEKHPAFPAFLSAMKGPLRFRVNLNHRKRLFLSIIIILCILLGVSIFLTRKNQQNTQTQTAFNAIYPQAKSDYDEGVSLLSLNKSLARDDFKKAETLLAQADGKFQSGSKEQQQIADLQQKVNQQLSAAAEVHHVDVTPTDVSNSPLLSAESDHTSPAITQDTNNIYYITDKAVTAIDKGNQKTQDVVTNQNDWTDPVGLGAYIGNLYILDRKNGVLKYVAAGNGFVQSHYFSSHTKPDFTNVVSMAIDGSVWVLFKDGSVSKYTRGQADSFQVSGLDTPFANPIKIYTDADANNIYILDTGNSRIVKIGKDGTYQAQYNADMLKTAQDMQVDEKNKKIYVLQNKKIFSINM